MDTKPLAVPYEAIHQNPTRSLASTRSPLPIASSARREVGRGLRLRVCALPNVLSPNRLRTRSCLIGLWA
jgi:hypothetical protein